LQSLVV